jgi:alkaline phosphatase D
MESNFNGDFTYEQGQAVFLEQVGMGEREWRTQRWGKDLQVWLVEGRNSRSPNDMPDGPDKTIWGEAQKAWFKSTFEESDASFRVLISPTPIVGPDRPTKADNHSNSVFQHEGDELRAFLSQFDNAFVVCGDRHWQYATVEPETGTREFSCGPSTNRHAGGFSEEDRQPMHKYLNVTGGFLEVAVQRVDGAPAIFFRHRSVDGELLNEEVFQAE